MPSDASAGETIASPGVSVAIRRWRKMRKAVLEERRKESGWDSIFLTRPGRKGRRAWLDHFKAKLGVSADRVLPFARQKPSEGSLAASLSSSVTARAAQSMRKGSGRVSNAVQSAENFRHMEAAEAEVETAEAAAEAEVAAAEAAAEAAEAAVAAATEDGPLTGLMEQVAVAEQQMAAASATMEALDHRQRTKHDTKLLQDEIAGSDPNAGGNGQGTSYVLTAKQQAEFDKRVGVLTTKESWDGWRGSKHRGELQVGIYEGERDKAKREQLRLLPEVQKLVEGLWECLQPDKGRVQLRNYLDFHLSVYHYIGAMEQPPVPPDEVDLIDAYGAAIDDWTSDTQDALEKVRKRELHFQLFRDSIFELIDLYTPSTDSKQYIGYTRSLVQQIKLNGALRFTWPRARKRDAAASLIDALHDSLGGTTGWDALAVEDQDCRVATMFGEWLQAQTSHEATAAGSDEADEHVTAFTSEGSTHATNPNMQAAEHAIAHAPAPTEVRLAGFLAAVDPLLESHLREGERESQTDAYTLVDVFRRFDVSATGLISLDDLRAVLVHREPSAWFPSKRRPTTTFKARSRGAMRKLMMMNTHKK